MGQSALNHEILILADDLTGALECGAAFAGRGVPAVVAIGDATVPSTRVHVLETGTRHVPEDIAALTVARLARRFLARLRYKKTDSTLRGNIRAELMALAEFGPVTYVPAYPQLGRTIRGGCLYVEDMPIEQTVFARDALHPVTHGDVRHLLGATNSIAISEANTEAEIEQAAREWIEKGGSAAGPAAMLIAAAAIMGVRDYNPPFPAIEHALVVSGSRHPCSERQIAAVSPFWELWGWEEVSAEQDRYSNSVDYAKQLAERAAARLGSSRFDALIVFGGDTASAVLKALNIQSVQPLGEILPGMPVSVLPGGLTLVTKAGGFGPKDVLIELHKHMVHANI